MDPPLRASFLAAFVAGLPVLLAFFVWHWLTIAPVWTVLAEGIVGVAVAALGVGWSWRESRRAGRFASRWGGLAFGAVFAGGLVLAELLGLALGPRADPGTPGEILAALPAPLAPVLAVALVGWRVVGRPRGALAYGAAALVLLLYLGGSVVHRGGVGLGLGLFLLLLPSYLAAGVLVAWLEPRAAARLARK